MQRDYVAVPKYWSVGQVIDYLRGSAKVPDKFYSIFVVDPRHSPVGTVPLYKMMRSKREIILEEIMTEDPILVPVSMDQEDIAYLFEQYDLTSAPVVNAQNRLIGMITVDDVVEVIEEEVEGFKNIGKKKTTSKNYFIGVNCTIGPNDSRAWFNHNGCGNSN